MKDKLKDFTKVSNTFTKMVKADSKDDLEIEIGDSKEANFKPQIKIKKWDNEVNFSMRAVEEVGAVAVAEDGKVKYKGKDIEVHQYEKPEAGEDGGYEFEWVLKKKPKSNVLRTTIQHKGLDFFYQPELTPEEIERGASRPENTVGSYAVYHKTKRDNRPDKHYKTGKAFHIYRPHAVDADGVEVWCELDITEGELTVTVPEKFLAKASYPVVVDPTFGYTSNGASSDDLAETNGSANTQQGLRVGVPALMSENGTLDSVSAYLSDNGSFIRTYYFYVNEKDSIGSGSHGQIFKGTDTTDTTTSLDTGQLVTVTAGSENLNSGTTYIVNIEANLDDSVSYRVVSINWDTGASENHRDFYSDIAGGSFQYSPWVDTGTFNRVYSIYATYNASGGGYNPAFAHRRLLL